MIVDFCYFVVVSGGGGKVCFPFFFFFGFAGVRLFISCILTGGVKLLTVEFFPLESSVRLAF